jgi:glutamyl-tRNA synthetase
MLIAGRTRFAPSPTGDLHLGGVWTAVASWIVARAAGGAFVLRVEDLDAPRIVPGAESRIVQDLEWLGLNWDEGPERGGPRGPYRQSLRSPLYDEAMAELARWGRVYPCDCSRAEVARVASAPHEGEEAVYPGTCRDKDPSRDFKRAPALRFRVRAEEEIHFDDRIQGPVTSIVGREAGDFVLKRGDGIFAYQLAVSVDDLAMGIRDVLRGVDLLGSTARQLLVMKALSASGGLAWAPKGGALPRYGHLPLVTSSSGARVAKRTPGATVRELRERGVTAETVVGRVAHALGVLDSCDPISPSALLKRARDTEIRFTKEPWPVPDAW